MTLLFLSTLAVCESDPVEEMLKLTMGALQPAINEATKQFFVGEKRLGHSCNMRDCEAPWICYNKKCEECQTGQEKDLVDGLMCKFPKMCMPMPHDRSKKGCINPAEWVNCGGHYAASCKACPGGNDKNYCNGDCEWFDPAGPANAPPKAVEPAATLSAANVASGAPVYHTYMSAPPEAVELLPFCRAKATTAAPPNHVAKDGKGAYSIVCSTTNLQTCSADRNCIWVWDGSGLDPAAKLSGTEPAKTEPANTLEKTGKCLVLESYLESSAVRARKKVNKLVAGDLDPTNAGAGKLKGICNKHSNWRKDSNKGVCEQENLMGVKCAWWNTTVLGGKCVAVSSTDVKAKDGGTCLIPFYYDDVKYDGCTTTASGNGKAWCKLDLRNQNAGLFRHSWDYCVEGAIESEGKNLNINDDESDISACETYNGNQDDCNTQGSRCVYRDDKCLSGCPEDYESMVGHVEGKEAVIEQIKHDMNKKKCSEKCSQEEECVAFEWHSGKNKCQLNKNDVASKAKLGWPRKLGWSRCVKAPPADPPIEESHPVQPASPPAQAPARPTLKRQDRIDAPQSLKQRTTQSFLAADNWE